MKTEVVLLLVTVSFFGTLFGVVHLGTDQHVAYLETIANAYITRVAATVDTLCVPAVYVLNTRVVLGTISIVQMLTQYLYVLCEWIGQGLWLCVATVTRGREEWKPNNMLKIASEDIADKFSFDTCQRLMFVFTWRRITSSRSLGHFVSILVDRFFDKVCCFYTLYLTQMVGYWCLSWPVAYLYEKYVYIRMWLGYPAAPAVQRPVVIRYAWASIG